MFMKNILLSSVSASALLLSLSCGQTRDDNRSFPIKPQASLDSKQLEGNWRLSNTLAPEALEKQPPHYLVFQNGKLNEGIIVNNSLRSNPCRANRDYSISGNQIVFAGSPECKEEKYAIETLNDKDLVFLTGFPVQTSEKIRYSKISNEELEKAFTNIKLGDLKDPKQKQGKLVELVEKNEKEREKNQTPQEQPKVEPKPKVDDKPKAKEEPKPAPKKEDSTAKEDSKSDSKKEELKAENEIAKLQKEADEKINRAQKKIEELEKYLKEQGDKASKELEENFEKEKQKLGQMQKEVQEQLEKIKKELENKKLPPKK